MKDQMIRAAVFAIALSPIYCGATDAQEKLAFGKLEFHQPPIEIGPCDSGQICWTFPQSDETTAKSAPADHRPEPGCALRMDLKDFYLYHFLVRPLNSGEVYVAEEVSYIVDSVESPSKRRKVKIARNGEKLDFSIAGCPRVKSCDPKGYTPDTADDCSSDGYPPNVVGHLVGPIQARIRIQYTEPCPTEMKPGPGKHRCTGPVDAVYLRGHTD